jgi:hypothetical protein
MLCTIIRPLLEIALDLRHLVGHEGEADHRLGAGLSEGIQAGHLHLDGFQPFGSDRIERRAGLPEWRIGGPGSTANRLDPGTLEFLGDRGKQMGVTVGVEARWEIGVAGALTAPRAVDQDRSGQCHGRIELTGGGDTDDQSATGGKKLLGDQDRKWSADGVADDANGPVFHLGLPEIGVIAGPAIRTAAAAGLLQPADHVAVGVEQADIRNWLLIATPLTPCLSQQTLRLKDGGLCMIGPDETHGNPASLITTHRAPDLLASSRYSPMSRMLHWSVDRTVCRPRVKGRHHRSATRRNPGTTL